MSTTQHKVGPVPSETDPVTPVLPLAPAPFTGARKVWAIIGIVALSFPFWPIGLSLGVVLLFVSGRRYRTVGIVGTAVSAASMVATALFYVVLLNALPTALNTASSVAPVVPDTTVSVPQQPTTGSIQPVASTPEELIKRIETYRFQAFWQGDLSLLDSYYPNHNDGGWRHDRDVIVAGKVTGNVYNTITGIKLISVTDTKIVAQVTLKTTQTIDGKTSTYLDSYPYPNTYGLINGRWYLTS